MQPDSSKLSVLLLFHIKSTPTWRLGNLASIEASIYNTTLRAYSKDSRGHGLPLGITLAKVGHDGCKVFHVRRKSHQLFIIFL